MTWRIETSETARDDLARLYEFIAAQSLRGAHAWLNAFDRSVRSLSTMPLACSLAPENDGSESEIRQLLFHTRSGLTYRALFTVTEDVVHILHIRGPGQDILPSDELESSP